MLLKVLGIFIRNTLYTSKKGFSTNALRLTEWTTIVFFFMALAHLEIRNCNAAEYDMLNMYFVLSHSSSWPKNAHCKVFWYLRNLNDYFLKCEESFEILSSIRMINSNNHHDDRFQFMIWVSILYDTMVVPSIQQAKGIIVSR